MVFSWISKLLPLGGSIIEGVRSVIKKKEDKNRAEDKIVSMIIQAYNSQFAGMNRDIALLRGWKPIVARVQVVDSVMKTWERNVSLSIVHKNPKIAIGETSENNIKLLLTQADEIKLEMRKLSGEAVLNWTEGSNDLNVSISSLEDKLNDLLKDVIQYKSDENKLLDRIELGTREVQEETKWFFSFWDSFLGDLFKQSKVATETFKRQLPDAVKSSIKVIQNEYPTETWDSVMTDVLNKLETVKSEIDEENNDE